MSSRTEISEELDMKFYKCFYMAVSVLIAVALLPGIQQACIPCFCPVPMAIVQAAECSDAMHVMTATSTTKVTVVYMPEDGKVDIRYVDENGYDILQPLSIYGDIGESFKAVPADIQGYTLINTIGNPDGIFGTDQKVTFVYGSSTNKATEAGGNKNHSMTSGSMHGGGYGIVKTGEDHWNIGMSLLLATALSISGIVLLRRRGIRELH